MAQIVPSPSMSFTGAEPRMGFHIDGTNDANNGATIPVIRLSEPVTGAALRKLLGLTVQTDDGHTVPAVIVVDAHGVPITADALPCCACGCVKVPEARVMDVLGRIVDEYRRTGDSP